MGGAVSKRPGRRFRCARVGHVFDDEGRLIGYLATPGAFRITWIGAQFVLGVHSDSLGVQTVRRYRLDR